MQKPTKHDRYVAELCDKIKDQYDVLEVGVKVRSKKRMLGEADIIARKGDHYDVYEVKCSHRITKAKKQLKRLSKYLSIHVDNSYFYCGSSGLLVLV